MEKLTNPSEMSTGLSKEISLPDESRPVEDILDRLHRDVLHGESYEDTSKELESIEALQNFRHETANLPFGSFSEAIEVISNVNKFPVSDAEKAKQIEARSSIMLNRANEFSPRVADLYQALLSNALNVSYEPRFAITSEKIEELKRAGEQGLCDLDILLSGDVSWELKVNRIEKSLVGYLSGVRALDRREGKEMDDDIRKWRQEELKKSPTRPPARRNKSKPGVDPMERLKEGERAHPVWSIYPPWGGYYKEQSFSKWDSVNNEWVEDNYIYSAATTIPLSGNQNFTNNKPIDITMRAQVTAELWISVPVPYTHELHKIEAGGRAYEVKQDQNGDLVVFVHGDATEGVELEVILAASPHKKILAHDLQKNIVPDMPSEFSEETNKMLSHVKGTKRGNIAMADAIMSYVLRRIEYLAPQDTVEAKHFNKIYNNSPKGFAGAVDEVRKGDCDVVNTCFAALCTKLNIPVRHCVGHSVEGYDTEGHSSINSGTGHGWSEILDEGTKEWVRKDATPAGDPNLEDMEKQSGGTTPGDYGTREAMRPSDEKLEALRKKLAEHKEALSYTKEERSLAEGASVELKEARQIVKEINETERTRLPNGELVVDVLAKLFHAIIESRKTRVPSYDGPVRKREGGEAISDIVRHTIGMQAGESDPISREKSSEEIQEEKSFGGFDVYLIGDKSGSMSSTVEGERLLEMQRRAEYLIFSSLHRFERNIERVRLQKGDTLSVRTQGISFRGDALDDIDLDKPLSPSFSSTDKVKLWHSLGVQGSGNGDVAALQYIYEQIENEIRDIEKHGQKDNRLRIIIACSDGGPDSPEGVQALAEKLGQLKAVVVGIGLTETAAAVPIIYTTPYSRGDIARDIDNLPAIVAKHIVLEAMKLFSSKVREGAKGIIENTIAKFKNIK